MALLHALVTLGRWSVAVATVDHGLHAASTDHARFVVAAAERCGVAAVRLVVDAARVRRGAGPEAAARAERYRLLRAHAATIDADCIVTAHTADDQAETILMRLGEGTGLRGLGGIKERRGPLARPWLGVSRAAVAGYAEAAGIEWIEDPSNGDARFKRNAVRQQALPGLDRALGPEWTVRAAHGAARVAGAQALLERCLGGHGLGWVREEAAAILIDRGALASLSSAAGEALVAHALQRAADRWAPGAGRRIATHVTRVLGGRGIVDLPGGLRARCGAERIRLERVAAPLAGEAPLSVTAGGRYIWGDWQIDVERLDRLPTPATGDFIATRAAPLPWTVRAAAPGERFRPLGAPGRRGLSRLWRDAGVARELRGGMPVIEAGDEPVWAAGLRAAEAGRATPDEPVWRVVATRLSTAVREPSASG